MAIPAVGIPLNCSSHNARKTITLSVISDRNMTTRSEDFAGLSVAITTPFRNGDVDYQRLGEQVEFQVAAGTTCIVPTGTTGESPTRSHEEHEQVISAVVDAAAGRAKVMAGTGSNSTAEAIRLTCWAAEAGADAALVVVPYYNKPTQQGLYEHFKAIAAEVEIPLCVYNIPGRTSINLEPQTLERLAELPEITMVKEATGQMDQASHLLASTDLTLLSGDDSLTLPLMAMGARGVISVVGNIVPRDMIALIEEFEAGNLEAARGWHHKLFPLCRDLLGLSTNPIPIKAAMKLLDRDTGQLRMPLTELDESELANLRGTLTRYGLL